MSNEIQHALTAVAVVGIIALGSAVVVLVMVAMIRAAGRRWFK